MDTKTERLQLALILIAWTAMQALFASTAFRVDETNIIRIAEQAARTPSDPYGFQINWVGRDESAFGILANPPLVPLWLAAWGSTFGWSETALHLSVLPFSLLAILAFWLLAGESGVDRGLATLLLIASPAFLLSSQVVMPDVAMLGFLLASIAAAFLYRRTGHPALLVAGFVAGFLAPVAKYNGVIAGGVLALLALFSRERRPGLFVIAAGPGVGLAAWSLWSLAVYGRAHLLVIAGFEAEGPTHLFSAMLAHFGLALLPLALAVPRAPRESIRKIVDLTTLCGFVWLASSAYFMLEVGPFAAIAYGVSAAIGLRFAAVALAVGSDWIRSRDVVGSVLFLWLVLGVWFQFGVLFSAVRYLLPLLPPAILLLVRAGLVKVTTARFRFALAACIAFSVAIAIGDARTANLYRAFVREVVAPLHAKSGGRLFFDGHWGFQYYAEQAGGKILSYGKQERWKTGDLVAIAKTPFPSHTAPQAGRGIAFQGTRYARSPRWPIRTIDCAVPANFYGPGMQRCDGPVLPYGFALGASDEFEVFVAVPDAVGAR